MITIKKRFMNIIRSFINEKTNSKPTKLVQILYLISKNTFTTNIDSILIFNITQSLV